MNIIAPSTALKTLLGICLLSFCLCQTDPLNTADGYFTPYIIPELDSLYFFQIFPGTNDTYGIFDLKNYSALSYDFNTNRLFVSNYIEGGSPNISQLFQVTLIEKFTRQYNISAVPPQSFTHSPVNLMSTQSETGLNHDNRTKLGFSQVFTLWPRFIALFSRPAANVQNLAQMQFIKYTNSSLYLITYNQSDRGWENVYQDFNDDRPWLLFTSPEDEKLFDLVGGSGFDAHGYPFNDILACSLPEGGNCLLIDDGDWTQYYYPWSITQTDPAGNKFFDPLVFRITWSYNNCNLFFPLTDDIGLNARCDANFDDNHKFRLSVY